MKYDNKDLLKKKCIELYMQGKTMKEISNVVGYSRNYVGSLIKDDTRIKEYKNSKIVKIYKLKNRHQMNVPISVSFLKKIGVSDDCNITDYLDVSVNEDLKEITIKKHKI